jgi:fatty aldehyde-generating acyl-ACP reductase
MKTKNKNFGFLVHPRNKKDFLIKFPYLKFLPEKALEFLMFHFPPVIASKITGLKNKDGEDINGYIIGITMTPRQMLEHREKAVGKLIDALKLAEKKDVGIVGLGALTASITRGGKDLVDKTSVKTTTGRVFTIKIVSDYVIEACKQFGLQHNTVPIAIVGAAGSIGSGCAMRLIQKGFQNFLLIDIERKSEEVRKRMEQIKQKGSHLNVTMSHTISDVKNARLIVAATNAPEAIILADDLSPGSIIINDAQPSDVALDVYERDDVLVIEGGVIHTPNITYNFNLGLASRNDTFCCLGEVLILTHHGRYENFSLGETNLAQVDEIEKLLTGIDISISPFQNGIEKIIPAEKIEKVKTLIQ